MTAVSPQPSVTPRRPGRPRDGALDAAILEATIEELIERGFIGLSVEAIAARAGVAKTTLYRRWPGTEELALAAIRTLQESPKRERPATSAREELLFLLERMRLTWVNPRYAALMRRVSADGTQQPEMYQRFRDLLIAPHITEMNLALARARDEGLIRDDVDLVWVRHLLSSPVLASALTHNPRFSRNQMEFVLDTILAGLKP